MLNKLPENHFFNLKEDFRQAFREQKLAQGERDKIVADIRITPKEVEAIL